MPAGHPDGARDTRSSCEHLLVIAFEWNGLQSQVGELLARHAMECWSTDHYRAVYKTALADPKRIWNVRQKLGLQLPAAGQGAPACVQQANNASVVSGRGRRAGRPGSQRGVRPTLHCDMSSDSQAVPTTLIAKQDYA